MTLDLRIAEGELRGRDAADALFGDFLLMRAAATLVLDDADAWSGALWRLGAEAYPLYLSGEHRFDAQRALAIGLADAIFEGDAEQWLAGRSALALESGAELIRRRGGDALERAEFARLFAAGEPQVGLDAFLRKVRADFARATNTA